MVCDNNALREILRKPNTEASSLALCLARRKKAIANQPQAIGEQKKQQRKWFNTKYYASVMNTKKFYEENLGWQFCGLISSALSKKNFSMNH